MSKVRRVLFLVNGLVRSYKAYSRNFRRFIEIARNMGFEVTLCGYERDSTDQVCGHLQVRELLVNKQRRFSSTQLLIRSAKEILKNYDIIVFGSNYTHFFPIYVLLLSIRPKPAKVIYYMQDPVPESFAAHSQSNEIIKAFVKYLQLISEKTILRKTNTLIVTCNDILKMLRKRNNLQHLQIEIAWNTAGINSLKKYENLSTNEKNRIKSSLIKRFGLVNDIPIILFSGKQQRGVRGLEQQFRVVRKLRQRGFDVKFVLTGHGDTQYFKQLAKDFNIFDSVIWTGVLNDYQLAAIHELANITIQPPIPYILQSKLFDALYMGLIPIVYSGSEDGLRLVGRDDVVYDGSDQSLLTTIEYVIKNLERFDNWVKERRSYVLDYERQTEEAFMHALLS